MQPNLLMNLWSAVHLPNVTYLSILCRAGSSGECAFRESLQGQYTSKRHHNEEMRIYYITGTAAGKSLSRISTRNVGKSLKGLVGDLRIQLTSNSDCWLWGDLTDNKQLVEVELVMPRIAQLPPGFLRGCRNLGRIDLSPLSRVIAIPSSFLHGCSSLTTIALSPLSTVTEIGSHFMSNCCSLTCIDLTPLRHITQLPSSFLCSCHALRGVDLSPLPSITSIGSYFLNDCTSLTHIDLAPLHRITVIPSGFLQGCSALVVVDLSPLKSSVMEVGSNFMANCSSLVTVDFQLLACVRSVGPKLLHGCGSLAQPATRVVEDLRAAGIEVE